MGSMTLVKYRESSRIVPPAKLIYALSRLGGEAAQAGVLARVARG